MLNIKKFKQHKSLKTACTGTDRSRTEKLWPVCGVMGDVILCDRERDIHPSQKLYATNHSEKMTYLTIILFWKRKFPAALCFRDEQ
jgi:hypothetical protein